MKVAEQLREIWRQATGREPGTIKSAMEAAATADRKTLALPAVLSPVQFPGNLLPKPSPMNLRRFAETPVVRRAINVIKDRSRRWTGKCGFGEAHMRERLEPEKPMTALTAHAGRA